MAEIKTARHWRYLRTLRLRYRWDHAAEKMEVQRKSSEDGSYRDDVQFLDAPAFAQATAATPREARRAGASEAFVRAMVRAQET